MREILFRGKAINRGKFENYRTTYKNGDWVYGLLIKKVDKHFANLPALPAEMTNEDGISGIDVDYKTIGQYTGLTDKNGKKIFEGDIVKHDFGEEQIGVQYAVVDFSCKYASFMISPINDWMYCDKNDCEVIGNIHDNPELLKGE